ncbi:MAG: hypothetical protein HYX53_13810 [Chloroflexi bacterium]|nr:hypothetical protein [Chloroflexota bacterium]
MLGEGPFLLVRAKPHEDARARFTRWFIEVHLADVKKIPGLVALRTGETRAGTRLGLYFFEDGTALQAGLSSPQAAYARGTWEQWAPHLDELLIEMFGTLAMPRYYASLS